MEFIEEAIISGFIGKVISDCIDISWLKIKEADKDRKCKNQTLNTRIYQIIIDAINKITYNKYRYQDILYNVAENLLNDFKIRNDNGIVVVKQHLSILISNVNNDTYKEFIKILRTEISKESNFDLYKEILIALLEQKAGYTCEELQQIKGQLKYITQKLDENIKLQKSASEFKKIKNRTQEYADKWNENMFLNNFDKRDEKAGVNIKLGDVYLLSHLPHYIWRENKKTLNDLNKLLTEYIGTNQGKKMLLILGQPGIGKSTLITWITLYFQSKIDKILVYQFASDLKKVNWKSNTVLNEILQILRLNHHELENKILILDGFDEISMGDNSEKLLNQLYQELKSLNLIENFTLIITCRENYVWNLQRVECNYITLQIWDSEQIRSFCKIYAKKNRSRISTSTINSILENKEILGTPLILYMVLALNIILVKNSSIVDIYDSIFSLEAGVIYDRCIRNSKIQNKSFDSPHRISEFKQPIHEISKKIAFWMFEYEPKETFIPQKEYEKICNEVIRNIKSENKEIKRDFLIGNYFKMTKYCEGIGTQGLHFVHRSIYEYFVADYIFQTICHMKSNKEIAGELGKILKNGNLSKQILEFIKHKFDKHENRNIPNKIMEIFRLMLHNGMTYFTKETYKKVIDREINIFSNMLKLVYLWNRILGEVDNDIIDYLQYNNRSELKLEGIKLEDVILNRVYLDNAYMNGAELNRVKLQEAYLNGAKLIGANLQEANLNGAKLEKADLSKATLIKAKLNKAHLNNADLIGAKLIKSELRAAELNGAKLNYAQLNGANLIGAQIKDIELDGAYLRDTIFDEKQVGVLKKKYNLNNSKVYIYITNEIISYMDYCKYLNTIKERR